MIKQITVVNAEYGHLSQFFPAGLQIDTDSPVVLLVGPNGSGKTAFLRMINSSLEFKKYYEEHGISKFFEKYFLDEVVPTLREDLTVRDVMEFGNLHEKWVNELFSSDERKKMLWNYNKIKRRPLRDLSEKKAAKEKAERRRWELYGGPEPVDVEQLCMSAYEAVRTEKGLLICPVGFAQAVRKHLIADSRFGFRPEDFVEHEVSLTDPEGQVLSSGYDLFIKTSALKQLGNVKKILKEKTDLNVWGYLKPEAAEPLCTMDLAPSFEFDNMAGISSKGRQYSDFSVDPDYDKMIYSHSTGQEVTKRVEDFFESVYAFFEKAQVPIWHGKPRTPGEGMIQWGAALPKTKKVSKGSSLVILADEPTDFLDYRNKAVVRTLMKEVVSKYHGRVQIYVATNDPGLIEGAHQHFKDCRFINLYQSPAQIARHFKSLNL